MVLANGLAEGRVETLAPIETVKDAACELVRIHGALGELAVEYTSEYLKGRYDGEEGETWEMYPPGFFSRPTPILDPVLRVNGELRIGNGYHAWMYLLSSFSLSESSILVPGQDGTFRRSGAVDVRRHGRGFDPGDRYAVIGERILQAGYSHQEPGIQPGDDGKLEWSTPRTWLSDEYTELTTVDGDLRRVVERLHAYTVAVVEPAA